jgi:parallel beta-helix repeat protein
VALERFAHVGSTTVSSGGTDAPASGTQQTWTVTSSAAFPGTLNQSRYFKVVDPAANGEVIMVKDVSGNTWTVIRGADSTTPVVHASGFTVTNIVAKATMDSVVADSAGIYNVLDYGALGDDSNADHVGIQAALSAAWADGGGTVVIPKGKYRIMQAPIRVRENIRVTASQGAVIKRYNDFSSLVWNGDGSQDRAGYTGHGNIIIEGGLWDMRCSSLAATAFSDTFTRANSSTSLGTSSSGDAWTATTGTLGINTNLAYAPGAGTNIAHLDGDANGSVSVFMPTVGNAGIVFRLLDSTNYWYYRRHTDGNARLGKVVAGVDTPMTADVTQAVAAGNELRVVFQDATIKAYVGATLTHTDVDTAHATRTGVGIHILDTTARLDDFAYTATLFTGTDDFNRANTAAPHGLGTSSSGREWVTEQGTLGIVSNTAFAPTAQGNISSFYGSSDGTVSVTMPTVGNAGLVFRMSDSQNYWYYRRHTDGNARMGRFVNGAETVMTADATQAVAAGNTLKVVMQGSTVRAYVGTTLTHTDIDATHQDERKVGIQILDTTARLDDFSSTLSIWADDFNRTNSSTSLGTSSSGQAWVTQSGTMGNSSNAAYAPSGGTSWATLDATSETNVTVAMPTVGNAGLIFRYKDNNNYWYYRRHTDGNARLGKVVAGVDTPMTADVTQAVAAGNTLKVVVLGWQIRAYVGIVQTHDDTDSDLYQESKVGIQILDTAARLDTFDSYAASGTDMSGACFNFGHGENITFRDLAVRDNSMQSHGVEICGCRNVLFDNCAFLGVALVRGREDSEAIQLDMTKGTSWFAAFGPHDHTTCKDVTIRNCTIGPSGSAGTQKWGRGTGSHSGTIGRWHDNIRVQGNFFEVGYRAVRGYNWNNAVVSGNNIASGNGIEIRPIWTGNTEDTKDVNGNQTSASQNIVNVVVADNTITADAPDHATNFAIRVFGEATGRIAGATVTGNVVQSSTSGGIRLEYVDRGIMANNTVNSTAYHGTGLTQCTESLAIGNNVQLAGQHGLYVQGGSAIRLFQNYVKGSSRAANLTYSQFKVDTSATEVTIGGNTARLFGSGNEAANAFHWGASGSGAMMLDNDFYGGGATQDVRWETTAEIGRFVRGRATSTTAVGTSITAVTGLSIPVAAGHWRFRAWIPGVNNAATGITLTVSPSGGPTTSALYYTLTRTLTTSFSIEHKTGFNSASGGTSPVATLFEVEGTMVATAAGTLSISMTRTGGTSWTSQIGAYIEAERLENELNS